MNSNLWQLDMPSEELKQAYLDKFLEPLRGRITNESNWNDGIISLFLQSADGKDNLRDLLIGDPKYLFDLNKILMSQMKQIGHSPQKRDIEKVFNYTNYLSNNKSNSYWLAKKIQRNTCVYCNRLYIYTVERIKNDGKVEHITRPDFDHWFPKSKYPLLSMSLMNLIPSCPICNSKVKRDKKFEIYTHIHPYIHKEGGPQIKFRASRSAESNSEWTVKLDCGNDPKANNTMEDLKLNEIYANHGSLEVKDLMAFKEAYPPDYINTLFDLILRDSNNKMSKADVYRFFFGTEMESDKFLDRPLSKMKYDILKELGWIIDKENTSK